MGFIAAYWQDTQFQNGAAPTVTTVTTRYRPTYSRSGIVPAAIGCRTNAFPSGPLTTAWLSFQEFSSNYAAGAGRRMGGFGLSSGTKGFGVCVSPTTTGKTSLYKFDGTTQTLLDSESGTSLPDGAVIRFDMQVVNFGATATVNVYVFGTLVISGTYDLTVTGMATNFDCVTSGVNWSGGNNTNSEMIVSTDDIRAYIGLQNLGLTGTGTTNQWTNNTFTNINGTTFTDTTPTYDNTNGQIQAYNFTDPLSPGAFTYVAVCQAARMAKSITTPAVTQVELGWLNVNQTLGPSYGTGATKTLTTVPTCYEQFDTVDPTTGVAFVQADMTAMQTVAKAIT